MAGHITAAATTIAWPAATTNIKYQTTISGVQIRFSKDSVPLDYSTPDVFIKKKKKENLRDKSTKAF